MELWIFFCFAGRKLYWCLPLSILYSFFATPPKTSVFCSIYVKGSFKTREEAAAAAAVESNKAWKKFTREFGCYAHVDGEPIQETARKIKEQEQIEKCIDVKMVVNDSEVKKLHAALQNMEIFEGEAKKTYKMNGKSGYWKWSNKGNIANV